MLSCTRRRVLKGSANHQATPPPPPTPARVTPSAHPAPPAAVPAPPPLAGARARTQAGWRRQALRPPSSSQTKGSSPCTCPAQSGGCQPLRGGGGGQGEAQRVSARTRRDARVRSRQPQRSLKCSQPAPSSSPGGSSEGSPSITAASSPFCSSTARSSKSFAVSMPAAGQDRPHSSRRARSGALPPPPPWAYPPASTPRCPSAPYPTRPTRGRGELVKALGQRVLAHVHNAHHVTLGALEACEAGCAQAATAGRQRQQERRRRVLPGRPALAAAHRGCVRQCRAPRRRYPTGGAQSGSSHASLKPPGASRCRALQSSWSQSPGGRQSDGCRAKGRRAWGRGAAEARGLVAVGAQQGSKGVWVGGGGGAARQQGRGRTHLLNMGCSSKRSRRASCRNTAPSVYTFTFAERAHHT